MTVNEINKRHFFSWLLITFCETLEIHQIFFSTVCGNAYFWQILLTLLDFCRKCIRNVGRCGGLILPVAEKTDMNNCFSSAMLSLQITQTHHCLYYRGAHKSSGHGMRVQKYIVLKHISLFQTSLKKCFY